MPVDAIHHFNIRAPKAELAELRDFYQDVIGLTVGFRPGFDVPGFWLYAGGRAVLHLLEMPAGESLPGVSARACALDHIAFRCSDLPAFLKRLDRLQVSYSTKSLPVTGETQLFLRDPAGIRIELNFAFGRVR